MVRLRGVMPELIGWASQDFGRCTQLFSSVERHPPTVIGPPASWFCLSNEVRHNEQANPTAPVRNAFTGSSGEAERWSKSWLS